ncbi:hypothetical protein Vretimale_1012 [Volvox reticuliferus]|nr:hypothetical protein Vretifemale_10545 [Volvox reticuliferus]GIL94858.1 hypothetical protein Vretimale_1012 [Volvox reticuliferus]
MANPGTVLRLKQMCGAGCAAVVLQGSEPIARALQADDFLAGPTPAHPLRKEDLALMILKWRSRQQVSGSSSNIPSDLSAGGALPNSAPGTTATNAFNAMPVTGLSARSPSGGAAAAVPSGALSPKSLQISQLQTLQAQLQALQQAKQEQKARGGVVTAAAQRSSNEIEPVGPPGPAAAAVTSAAVHVSPSRRPPPLRLASAGVPPTDAYPDVERNLARSSTPVLNGNTSIGGVGIGVTDVNELVAQVAELRRKLGDKSRTASMRSPTGSVTGGMALSPTSSLSGNFASGRTASGALAGALNSGGSEMGNAGGGATARSLSQQLALPPFTDLNLQLQSLQTKQKALQKMVAGGGSGHGGGPGNNNGAGGMAQQFSSGSSTAVAAMASGLGASQGVIASSSNNNRQPPLQSFGSVARPSVEPAAMAVPTVAAGPSPPRLASLPPASQLASLQLQQQLLQLQQLQLQLQQQQRLAMAASGGLGMAAAPTLTLEALQPGSRLLSTSPTGSLTSNLGSPLPSPGNAPGTLQAHVSNTGSDSGSVSRSNSFVAAGGTRYRPPRQRSPSPLGSTSGVAAGHISDTYPGPGASRFASPQFRSGSGSGAAGAAASGAGRRGAGTGSGHTSDSGASPDLRHSARERVSGGSKALARKSGDDAIAAALNAASGEADAGPDSSVGSPASVAIPSSAGTAAAELPNTLADAVRGLEGAGDGGSSTDGRSLMDASFVLEGSAGGGRGSISGGAASSIDLQPSPSTPATPPSPALPDAQQRQPQSQPQPRSNLGGTRLGSHRISSSRIQGEPSEDDDQSLRASATRQPLQVAGVGAPVLRPASITSGVGGRTNVPSNEATPPVTSTAGAVAAETTAKRPEKPSDAAEKSVQPLVQPAASTTPQTVELISAAGSGSGSAHPQLQDSPSAPSGPRAAFPEEDSVRVESPDSSAAQLHIEPSPPMPQQHALSSSKGSARGSAFSGGGKNMDAHPPAATQAARLARSDSQCDDRLPSIDGTQPITAAAIRGGGESSADGHAAAALSSLGRRQGSNRSAGSDSHRGEAACASGKSIHVISDRPSTDASAKVPSATGTTSQSQFQPPIQSSNPVGSMATCQSNDGGSLVASIEGSITAGLPRTGSRGATGSGQFGPGMSTPQLVSSVSRGRSGPATGYTDDIFPLLQTHERREVFSPAPLTGGDPQQQLQPPARPGTPPARRAARILLCSHPIVITREDFLPF